MSKRIKKPTSAFLFYIASFPSIYRRILSMLISAKLQGKKPMVQDAVRDLKMQGITKFSPKLRFLMICALILNMAVSILKLVYCMVAQLMPGIQTNVLSRKRISNNLTLLRTVPIVFWVIMTSQ